ncbi:MAG: N-acetyl-alpha-D-glucosaminyl L-malate synthase BshA [Saprospirales bacterium]|nr:MAG: N-acetyl-alpha-D-glucosaminyl L-malate synthase BshA [Saprospirales bacterium]
MKIGIVCYPTYGGSGVVATELGISLANRGHQVHFITYRRPARLTGFQENIFYHEVNTLEYPLFEYTPFDSALASKLVDVVMFEKLDLLHVHYAIPHATVAYLAKMILRSKNIHVPVITTLHGTDITLVGNDPSFAPAVEFGINESEGVTAVSKNLKESTLNQFEVNREIEVIPNFIDLSRFNRQNKEHFRKAIAPNEEFIVTHTSNFRKVKRVDDVIRIFQGIVKHHPAKLLLVGDGPERRNLENLCRQLGICHQVVFLGKQDAIEEILAVSDLFVIPSENESFGLAALEALACQVPVIASNVGGLPEVVLDDFCGYLRKVGDVESMAEAAISLLEDKEKHQLFRENALKQARKYEISRVVPIYEAYYCKVINDFSKKWKTKQELAII